MRYTKIFRALLALLVLISCTASMAMAQEAPNDDKELTAEDIYSEGKVLGKEKGDGKLTDLFDIDEYIATLSAFEVLWAVIMLSFALLGSAIIILYLGVIFWNALKKIIASKGENADQAVNEIKKINNKDTSLSIGVGFSFVLVAVTMFLVSFL
jgi:hypothetical protein